MFSRKEPEEPPVLVRRYEALTQAGVVKKYERDAQDLAKQGYFPVSEASNEAQSLRLGFGIWKSVTYRKDQVPSSHVPPPAPTRAAPARATKRCPDCGEDVLAEARVCRFCRYAFPVPSVTATKPKTAQAPRPPNPPLAQSKFTGKHAWHNFWVERERRAKVGIVPVKTEQFGEIDSDGMEVWAAWGHDGEEYDVEW